MNDDSLPAELQDLESRLTRALNIAPPSALASGVAASVRNELCRQRRADRVRFAVAVAAVLLIGLNLSTSAAPVTDFHFCIRPKPPQADVMAATIRDLCPDWSLDQARAEALFLQAGQTIVPMPSLSCKGIEWPSQ